MFSWVLCTRYCYKRFTGGVANSLWLVQDFPVAAWKSHLVGTPQVQVNQDSTDKYYFI